METTNTNTIYNNTPSISSWAEDDIPSSKILLKGTASMSNAELLSILFELGNDEFASLEKARKVLSYCGNNLCNFWKLGIHDLQQIDGISRKSALQMVAMFALARRRNESEVIQSDKIKSSRDAFRVFQATMGDTPFEEFWILALNRGNQIVKKVKISEGGISGTVVDPKKVFKVALDNHASSIIMGHNHPSGMITPSEADNKLTKKMVESGKLLEISVLDHIIVAQEGFYSYADEGAL